MDNGNIFSGVKNADFMSYFTQKTSTPPHRQNGNGNYSELCFSPSPAKSSTHQFDCQSFCNESTKEECVANINNEITGLGMPSLYSENSDTIPLVPLINCTHDLLQKYKKSFRTKDELEIKVHRLEGDVDYLQKKYDKLKLSHDNLTRDFDQVCERERQKVNSIKSLEKKLKTEKDTVRQLRGELQHRIAQYKHESKRKERERDKLRERLHQALTERKPDRGVGLEISQQLQRADGKRGTWTQQKRHEEEMYRQVISTYEDKQKELVKENGDLRQSLCYLQEDLVKLFHKPSSPKSANTSGQSRDLNLEDSSSDDEGRSPSTSENLSEGHFQMPYDMVQDDILHSLRHKLKLLARKQKGANESISTPSKPTQSGKGQRSDTKLQKELQKENEKLKKQNQSYKEIINQLQDGVMESTSPGGQMFSEADLWEEKDALEVEKQLFYEQKINFEGERKNFTEAAIRLGIERKKFEDQKASYLKQQFLNLTPFQARDSRQLKSAGVPRTPGRIQRQLPSTPNQNPKDVSSVITPQNPHPNTSLPSTVDLYRTLGLTVNTDMESTVTRSDTSPASCTLPRQPSDLGSPTFESPQATSVPTSPISPIPNQRHTEHKDQVKLALFRKLSDPGFGGCCSN